MKKILTAKRTDGRDVTIECVDEGRGPDGTNDVRTSFFTFDGNPDHWIRISVPHYVAMLERFEADRKGLEDAGIDTSTVRFPAELGGHLVWTPEERVKH